MTNSDFRWRKLLRHTFIKIWTIKSYFVKWCLSEYIVDRCCGNRQDWTIVSIGFVKRVCGNGQDCLGMSEGASEIGQDCLMECDWTRLSEGSTGIGQVCPSLVNSAWGNGIGQECWTEQVVLVNSVWKHLVGEESLIEQVGLVNTVWRNRQACS